MKAKITGDKRLMKTMDGIVAMTGQEITDALMKIGFKIKTTAITSIQHSPASGKVYEKYTPRRTHKASAPGEPPATDEGTLVRSIEVTQRGNDVYVFTDVDHGRYLELGTLDIRPRPWLKPALKEHEEELPKGIKKAVMSGIKKATKKS